MDRFVGEKYSIRYVASGRDLLREAKAPAGPKTTMHVFANPDFGGIATGPRLEQTNAVALRSVEMRDLEGISLPSLPGTEKEAAELETRAKKSNWQPQTYLGPNATEAELRKVSSPRVLHLATHGFFLPEIDLGTKNDVGGTLEIPKGKLVNPMHRSNATAPQCRIRWILATVYARKKRQVARTETGRVVAISKKVRGARSGR